LGIKQTGWFEKKMLLVFIKPQAHAPTRRRFARSYDLRIGHTSPSSHGKPKHKTTAARISLKEPKIKFTIQPTRIGQLHCSIRATKNLSSFFTDFPAALAKKRCNLELLLCGA
jgi:hypothetical protein